MGLLLNTATNWNKRNVMRGIGRIQDLQQLQNSPNCENAVFIQECTICHES